MKNEAAANFGSVASAGKVGVLGLEGIRFRLGDRWEGLSEKVHAYISALLEREMKPGDCFHKVDELSYLILFRDLSVTEAQLKCVAIAEAASRRLFGADFEAVSVRVVVAAIGLCTSRASPGRCAGKRYRGGHQIAGGVSRLCAVLRNGQPSHGKDGALGKRHMPDHRGPQAGIRQLHLATCEGHRQASWCARE